MREVIAGNVVLTETSARHATRVDASDCWEAILNNDEDRDLSELTHQALSAHPGWVRGLMWLRNTVVKLLGLAASNTETGGQESPFPVLEENTEEIVMGVHDRHLDFWVSSRLVKTEQAGVPDRFSLTTYVRINNRLGRLYWGIVQHVHPSVVKAGLRRI